MTNQNLSKSPAKRRGLLAALAAVFSVSAGAQEAPETGAAEIEEIIVTARRREENIQDIPLSVTAFTAAELEARSLSDLSDIGKYTPNLSFRSTSGGSGGDLAEITIRGLGQQDYVNTKDPGVGIYIDGVYHGRAAGGVIDLLDLERAEVLRGPQGTLFGKNTLGGAISMTTVKPGPELGGYAQLTYGRFDRI